MQLIKKWLTFFTVLLIVGCNSDLDKSIPEDSNWSQYQLDNGLRYHLYPTEDKEISIRLMIHAGSMQESDKQKGYAHFVEHMAFNGSRHFTGNEVIRLFEKTGGSFGADINAFTSYQLTAYKMDLSDKQHLPLALTWMRDVADGIEFSPEQVEREKGVILGEFRASRSENEPLFTKAYLEAVKGSVLEDKDPLGTEDSVKQASAKALKDYYRRWYQPQNAELIISGNISNEELSTLITQQFSTWKNNGKPAVNKQRDYKINNGSYTLLVGEMESPSLHFLVDRGPIAITTYRQQYQYWLDEVTQQLITQRLQAAFNNAAQAVQYSGSYSQWIGYNRYAAASIAFSADNREASQQLFLQTVRSLRDYGVSQSELESIMTGYRNTLSNFDNEWNKRKPIQIVDDKVFAIEQAMPVQSRETNRQALNEFVTYIDLKRVNKNIEDLLSSNLSWLQGYSASESLSTLEQELIKLPDVYAQTGFKPLELQDMTSELKQPKAQGEIVSRTEKEGDFTVWQLSNGVEVWYQRDPQAGQRAHLVYASQGGKAALTPDLYAASDLLPQSAARSGLGEFNGAQFDSYLRKKGVAVYPFISFTFHGLEVNTEAKALPLALNTIFNISTEVKVEPRQLEAVKQEFYENNNAYYGSPEGQWYKAINAETYQPHSRHRFVLNSDIASVTTDQLLQVHQRLFHYNRGNKLVIIADLEPAQIAPMLRKYIASINLSNENVSLLNFDNQYKGELAPLVEVNQGNEKGTMLLTRLINTQKRAKSAKDVFAEDALQRIASARLLDEVREKRGLDYSPEVYPVTQDGEWGSDWFVTAKVASEDLKEVQLALKTIFDGLANSITEEEVSTAVKQLAVAVEPINDDPIQRAWFYSRYLIHGYGIEALLDIEGTANSITLDDLQQKANWVFGAKSKKLTATLSPQS
ncbi:peptidase [Vibrio panuliri]|uniref:Peptidase n=1 Tax=Vibrio panuliri TaxID=1381081 RepID=A0A1Q9H9G6_9VIBR|nr:M16 family metallopeptidase [Vibrio panuliri]OLQ85584.1 peptidase [Vibrio panuliri]